ncbi:MAG: hypothetical protein IJ538_02195 [Clostridia bacterium]|nr:hypothetical protein [Clostridia bacterium]
MKQKSNQKFFYSKEEDEVIVSAINEDLKRRQEERRVYELTWGLNMNYYIGNQFSYISSTGEILDIEKNYYWENREVFNHIAPVIETRLAKLSKIKPNLTVRPSSSSENDVAAAELTKSILNYALDSNNFDTLISSATAWSEITGTSFYKVSWDNEIGPIIANDQNSNNYIKSGDAVISVCSPFEIYPDSNSSIEIDDCASIIEARAYPVDIVNETWGVKLTGEDVDTFEIATNTLISGFSGRSNISKLIHSPKHNHILVVEKYEKPTQKRPNGRLTITAKNILLYDGDLPYKIGKNNSYSYPFVKQVSTKQLSCFWGISVIERCIPLQRTYNAIKNKKHEFIARLASGVLSVEDGSVDVNNLEDEGLAPGKILIYRNGSHPPEFIQPGTVPNELEDEEKNLLNEINNLSCISDVTTNSSIPSGINSGSALSMLIKQDESRLSLTAEYIRDSIKKVGVFLIKLYKQFTTQNRLDSITDKNGKIKIYYWNNSNITSDDVIFETKNELLDDASTKEELAIKLLEKGLFNDSNGKILETNKSKLLDLFGFKDWVTEKSIDECQKERAQKENLKLIKLNSPLEIDDHKIHINEHIKFLITLKDEDFDTNFEKKLLQHINEHKKFLGE